MRPAPTGYIWIKSVNYAIQYISYVEDNQDWMNDPIIEISLDHDAGDYGPPDYIKILDWLEETNRSYPIHIHSMNPVGVANMRAIIEHNGWTEIR